MTIKKDTATAHVNPAANVTISQHAPSIAQTISQVQAEMPGGPAGGMQSGLPSAGLHPGAEVVGSRAGEAGNGATDPTQAGSTSSLDLNTLNSGIASLVSHDPMSNQDPTQRPGLFSTSMPSADTFQAALAQAGVVVDSQQDPLSPDTRAEDMLGTKVNDETGQKTETQSDYTDANHHQHHEVQEVYSDSVVTFDQDKTDGSSKLTEVFDDGSEEIVTTNANGAYAIEKKDKDGNETIDVYNAQGHETERVTSDKDGNGTTDTYDSHGNVVSHEQTTKDNDGDTTRDTFDAKGHLVDHVTEDKKGHWTEDTYDAQGHHTDHRTGTYSSKMPDQDHQGAVNLPYSDILHDAMSSIHQPSHENDNRNVVDTDVPGLVSSSDLKGGGPVLTNRLLSDNGTTLDGPVGGPVFGGPAPNNNRARPDVGGPDDNSATAADGPSVRNEPGMKTNVSQSGHEQSGGDHNGGHDSASPTPISIAIETAVQHADSLLDGSNSHKTAQSVEGAHSGNDIASVLGGNTGSAGAGHDFSGFADLIRLAQNPVQAGLAAPAAAATHDPIAALQLAVLSDAASHLPGVQHFDDLHVATSATVAVHDDHAQLTVPVVDHGHAH
jgi:hypothetical protein